jgi:predicted TIM-barrel fold metal-dependent hydrolase
MILRVSKDFPELTIIAAHLGGLNMWAQAAELLAGKENVYMETSMTYEKISQKWAEKIIRRHGHHKIFFGTDYPFAPIKKCIESARCVSFLNEKEKEEIMGLNAMQFFKP